MLPKSLRLCEESIIAESHCFTYRCVCVKSRLQRGAIASHIVAFVCGVDYSGEPFLPIFLRLCAQSIDYSEEISLSISLRLYGESIIAGSH